MIDIKKMSENLTKELNKTKEKKDKLVNEQQVYEFLEEYQGSDRVVTSEYLIEKVKCEGIRQPMSTGIEDLDEIIGGFYEEQVIVLLARPKHGKTSFAMHLTKLLKERNPLLLLLEQSGLELVEQYMEQGKEVPHFYTPQSIDGIESNTDWINLKILESQYRARADGGQSTKFVVIDHFGYISTPKTSDQATWGIIATMQALKAIAKQTKVAIVVVVHTTKGDVTNPPSTEDLFGSAGYHQEADTVVSLWRETYEENGEKKQTRNMLLQVLANRKKGDSGAVRFTYDNGDFIQNNWVGHEEARKKERAKVDEDFKNYKKHD